MFGAPFPSNEETQPNFSLSQKDLGVQPSNTTLAACTLTQNGDSMPLAYNMPRRGKFVSRVLVVCNRRLEEGDT